MDFCEGGEVLHADLQIFLENRLVGALVGSTLREVVLVESPVWLLSFAKVNRFQRGLVVVTHALQKLVQILALGVLPVAILIGILTNRDPVILIALKLVAWHFVAVVLALGDSDLLEAIVLDLRRLQKQTQTSAELPRILGLPPVFGQHTRLVLQVFNLKQIALTFAENIVFANHAFHAVNHILLPKNRKKVHGHNSLDTFGNIKTQQTQFVG